MKRLFGDGKENIYRYGIVALLVLFSASLTFGPTGLAAYSAPNEKVIDRALELDSVREFVVKHDADVIIERLDNVELLKQYPDVYSGVPEKAYQIIFDAGEKSLVVILDENAVYRVFENS